MQSNFQIKNNRFRCLDKLCLSRLKTTWLILGKFSLAREGMLKMRNPVANSIIGLSAMLAFS